MTKDGGRRRMEALSERLGKIKKVDTSILPELGVEVFVTSARGVIWRCLIDGDFIREASPDALAELERKFVAETKDITGHGGGP